MSDKGSKHPVTVVSAVMRADGLPDFAVTHVEVTLDQAENGIQYYLAEADLLERGFEEPFVHYAEEEAPPFLFPAVLRYLGIDAPATAAHCSR